MIMRPLAAVVLAGACTCARAQTEPLLSGPKVEEARLPGIEETLTGAGPQLPGMSAGGVPNTVFRRAIEALGGEDVPDVLRLTAAQGAEIAALQRAHAVALRGYLAEHQDEIAELRRAARRAGPEGRADRRVSRPSGGADRSPPSDVGAKGRTGRNREAMDGVMGEAGETMGGLEVDPQELRRRIQAIRRGGPQDLDVQTRIWSVLTEGQQAEVGKRIEAYRAEEEKRRQQRYMQRFLSSRAESGGGSGDESGGEIDLSPELALFERGLPARLRERLGNLEPEQRVRLLKRLQERASDRRR